MSVPENPIYFFNGEEFHLLIVSQAQSKVRH